jgi:hypothetical protein
MPDEIDLTPDERRLETELTALGPAMERAARARASAPDPAFVDALRASLVAPEPVAPDRSFERRLRTRLVGHRFTLWPIGLAGAVALAAALVLLLLPHPTHHPSPLAVGIPRPSAEDLLRNYPPPGASGGGGGYLAPTASRLDTPHAAYSGRLVLSAHSLTGGPDVLPVYQLAPSPFGGRPLGGVAHRLGISGPVICMNATTAQQTACTSTAWRVVALNLYPSHAPLHSLALSPSGEAIYHDLRPESHSPARPLGAGRAVADARAWLRLVGVSAASMPVEAAHPAPATGQGNNGNLQAVSFGWATGLHTTVPEVTLWVDPAGRVTEARLWPAVATRKSAAARSTAAAWSNVAANRAPVAVEGVISPSTPSGTGVASRVSIVEILVTPPAGHSYLEAAYKFSGTVRLAGGEDRQSWYALVPAIVQGSR